MHLRNWSSTEKAENHAVLDRILSMIVDAGKPLSEVLDRHHLTGMSQLLASSPPLDFRLDTISEEDLDSAQDEAELVNTLKFRKDFKALCLVVDLIKTIRLALELRWVCEEAPETWNERAGHGYITDESLDDYLSGRIDALRPIEGMEPETLDIVAQLKKNYAEVRKQLCPESEPEES